MQSPPPQSSPTWLKIKFWRFINWESLFLTFLSKPEQTWRSAVRKRSRTKCEKILTSDSQNPDFGPEFRKKNSLHFNSLNKNVRSNAFSLVALMFFRSVSQEQVWKLLSMYTDLYLNRLLCGSKPTWWWKWALTLLVVHFLSDMIKQWISGDASSSLSEVWNTENKPSEHIQSNTAEDPVTLLSVPANSPIPSFPQTWRLTWWWWRTGSWWARAAPGTWSCPAEGDTSPGRTVRWWPAGNKQVRTMTCRL